MLDNSKSFIIDALACEIGGRTLFQGLGICLMPGALLVIKGENGSGKSTLLSQLAGLHKPASGKIEYAQEDIYTSENYSSNSLFLSHNNCLNPQLTVWENMRYWQKLMGEKTLIDAAIHYFDLEPLLEMRCSDLSMGWQQRVSLARLIYIPASVWLLDEPTSHLDDDGIALFNSLIMSRMEQGGIIVMSTHAQLFNKEIKILFINDFC